LGFSKGNNDLASLDCRWHAPSRPSEQDKKERSPRVKGEFGSGRVNLRHTKNLTAVRQPSEGPTENVEFRKALGGWKHGSGDGGEKGEERGLLKIRGDASQPKIQAAQGGKVQRNGRWKGGKMMT